MTRDSPHLPLLSYADFRLFIFTFVSKDSAAEDRIRDSDLKRNFDVHSDVLLNTPNGFLTAGFIPDERKVRIIRPLFKGGSRNNVKIYHQISRLPFIALILEKPTLITMTSFAEIGDILSPIQQDFTAGRGT